MINNAKLPKPLLFKTIRLMAEIDKTITQLTNLVQSPIFRRWLDIIFLSAIIIIIFLILGPLLLYVLNWWDMYTQNWAPLLQYAKSALLAALAFIFLSRIGALHPSYRLSIMLRYPPAWLSSFLVVIFFGGLVVHGSLISFSLTINDQYLKLSLTLISVLIGLLLAFFYVKFEETRFSHGVASSERYSSFSPLRNIFDNDMDFINWVTDESPIRYPSEDAFDHVIPARRIARFLLQESHNSFWIVGPYGCGKSSLINLIEYYILHPGDLGSPRPKSSGQVIRCNIDGWGRVSGSVAQKILELGIEKVKRHVDCTSIISLPDNYHRAIAGTKSPGVAVLSALLRPSPDPGPQLSRLDDILAASKLRLIIFLEDLDRNVDDKIIDEEMPALLDRLHKLKWVTFVWTSGAEPKSSELLARICDHMEVIS